MKMKASKRFTLQPHCGTSSFKAHLCGPVFDVDLGHVEHITQAFNAVPLPGPNWF